MAVTAANMKLYKSSNANSDGGTITATEITGNVDNELIPDLGPGTVIYRKIFLKNIDSTYTANNIMFYITNISTQYVVVDCAMGTSNDTTPPNTWYRSTNYETGIQIGALGPGASQGLWIRVVSAAVTVSTGTGGSAYFSTMFAWG